MTNEGPSPGPLPRGFSTGRLEAFSDVVFAIAVTLLVLDVAIPAAAEQHLLRSVVDLWPSYLGYVVSPTSAMWSASRASAPCGSGTTRSPSTSTAPTPCSRA